MKPRSKSEWMTPAAPEPWCRGGSSRHGPPAPGGEVGDQVEQAVGRVDQAVQAGLVQAHAREKLVAFRGLELRDLGLHRAADADDLGAFFGGALLDRAV